MTRDTFLKRITVASDDGDVYCHGGNVGISKRVDDLDAKTTTLTPPKCTPPGGDKLRFDGT